MKRKKNACGGGGMKINIKTAALAAALVITLAAAARAQEYSPEQIEGMYANVASYYNPKLSETEARRIARSILYHTTALGVDPRLVVAVIVVESRFKPNAVSPKGAIGLGQLMPGTARSMGISNPYSVDDNIYGTVRYLRTQYDRWQNTGQALDFALASYNAGPEAVARHGGIPPYNETINYVKKVKRLFNYFKYGR